MCLQSERKIMSVSIFFNKDNESKFFHSLSFNYPYPKLLIYLMFASKRRFIDNHTNCPTLHKKIGSRLSLISSLNEIYENLGQAREVGYMIPQGDTKELDDLKSALVNQISEFENHLEPIVKDYLNVYLEFTWCFTKDLTPQLEKWNFNTATLGKSFVNQTVKLRRFVMPTDSVTYHPFVKFLTCDPMLYFLALESKRCNEALDK